MRKESSKNIKSRIVAISLAAANQAVNIDKDSKRIARKWNTAA